MSGDNSELDVFISYAREQLPLVKQLAAVLDAYRLNVFYDMDDTNGLAGSTSWRLKLKAEVDRARVVLGLLCPRSVHPDRFAIQEMTWAGKRLLPVKIEQEVVVPDWIGEFNIVNMLNWDMDPRKIVTYKLFQNLEGRGLELSRDETKVDQLYYEWLYGPHGQAARRPRQRPLQPAVALTSEPKAPNIRREEPSKRGRIRIDAFRHECMQAPYYLPGAGSSEWFCDLEGAPEMILIPSGVNKCGARPDEPGRTRWEEPRYEVRIARPFTIGRTPVTEAQWALFTKAAGGRTRELRNPTWPVVDVTWYEAQEYCTWLREQARQVYRLPSEAEWEYAARSGHMDRLFFWGDDTSDLPQRANYDASVSFESSPTRPGPKGLMPVASFAANDFGLHDMLGNVAEWVADDFRGAYDGKPSDGSASVGKGKLAMIRGGSWHCPPQDLRCAHRDRAAKRQPLNWVGFRVVRELSMGVD